MDFIDPDDVKGGYKNVTSNQAMPELSGSGFIDPDEAPAPKSSGGGRSLKQQAKKMVQDIGGFGQAGLDVAGSLPGFAAGLPGFVDEVIRNKEPQEAFEHLMGFASEHNLMNHLPKNLTALRDTEGYEVANKTLANSLKIFGQGAGNIAAPIAEKFGSKDPSKVGEYADVGTQLGIMGAGTIKGMKGPAKGSPEWFAQERARTTAPQFIDPDEMAKVQKGREEPDFTTEGNSSQRNRPESDNLFNAQMIEPGEVLTDDGRKMQQEVYDPGVEPSLREQDYFGPRDKGEVPDNGMDYQRTSPEMANRFLQADTPAARDAQAKPGFQRSAEEVMRARELEKASSETLRDGDRSNETLGAPRRLERTNWEEFKNAKLPEVLERTQNARAGIEHIKRTSEVPFYRTLAEKLLSDKEFRPDLDLTEDMSVKGRSAEYSLPKHTIHITAKGAGSEQTFLHEAIHARVAGVMESYLRDAKTFKERFSHLVRPIERIKSLYDSLEAQHTEKYGSRKDAMKYENIVNIGKGAIQNDPVAGYRLSYGSYGGIHEFVAEGLTNPAFQSYLAQLKLPAELRTKGFQRYWDSFVDAVRRLMGVATQDHTYLNDLIRTTSDLMEGTGKEERTALASKMRDDKRLGALELEPEKEIQQKQGEKKGIMGAVMDHAREFALDRRPFDQFYKEDLEGKKLQDFSPKAQGLVKRAYNRLGSLAKREFLQDTTIALLMKATEGTGPLIKWTVDQISRIDRDYMGKTKQAIEAGLNPFRRMFREDRAALGALRNKWMENVGRKDLGPADFASDKQWKVYEAFQKVHDQILKDVNAKRAEAGYKPIERIPSYFHSMWEGDYRLFGYDAKGEKVWAYGYKTEWGAERDIKKLQKQHPEIRWEAEELKRNKYGLMDLSAFEEALDVLSKDDPATRIIQQTYRDILQHRGFGKTGLHKKGVQGFIGEVGDLRDMERAFTQYVEQAHRYLGNLEKQKVLADLQKLPKEQREQVPMTMDFLNSYIHKARGGRGLIDWETKTLDELGTALGLGMNAPRNLVRGMSQIVYMYYLTTPRFLVAQSVQSINAIPKLIQEYGTFDGLKAFYDGWAQTIKPDAIAKEGTEWAQKKQYLDPTIRNLIHKEWGERPTTSEGLREVLSWPAAWIEHNIVRAPVFLMFEKALRESITDKETRFEVAAQKADYYMVNYNRTHAPAVYDNLGIAGDALRPLKMYSHNYIGQFLEFAQGAKNKGEYAPLAAFFATQVMVAGLKGTMLVAEATIAINLINAIFDTSIPTPEQALMKSGLHDALVFGSLSTILSRDVSSSVAAPGLPSMLNFPAVEFTIDMIHDVGNYAIQFLKGQETDQDRLRAWLAITPSAAHEWLKNLYTPQGQPTANPNDSALKGNFRRDDFERTVSGLTGTKSIDEARADALVRSVRKELTRDANRKLDAVDAIVDRIQSGQKVDSALFEKYIKNGGDSTRLTQTIMERIKQRQLTGVERIQDHQVTQSQAHKLDLLKDYLNAQTPHSPQMFDPKTGRLVEPRALTMADSKNRLYSDTEGNPQGGFSDRMEERMQRMPKDYGQSPDDKAEFQYPDREIKPEFKGKAQKFERNPAKRQERKYGT